MFGNTLRIKPLMCLTKGNADFICETLDKVLGEVEGDGEVSVDVNAGAGVRLLPNWIGHDDMWWRS